MVPGTPAARYGLKAGDIVTAVDNTPIYDADGLVLNVGKLPAEAVTRLSVLRGGNPRTIEVTLSKYAVRGRKIVTAADPAWRGLRVEYPTAVVDDESRVRGGMSSVDDAVIVDRGGRGLAGLDRGPAPGDADYAGRPHGGPHAQGVCRGGRPQSRPRPTPPGRRRKKPGSHGAAREHRMHGWARGPAGMGVRGASSASFATR